MKKLFLTLVLSFSLIFIGCGGGVKSEVANGAKSEISDNSNVGVKQVSDNPEVVTILGVDYPLYPNAVLSNKVGNLYTYIFSGDAEEVFAWYKKKMSEDGWVISVDGSDGKVGQIIYKRGDLNDRPNLQFVLISVFNHSNKVSLSIAPQANKYRK